MLDEHPFAIAMLKHFTGLGYKTAIDKERLYKDRCIGGIVIIHTMELYTVINLKDNTATICLMLMDNILYRFFTCSLYTRSKLAIPTASGLFTCDSHIRGKLAIPTRSTIDMDDPNCLQMIEEIIQEHKDISEETASIKIYIAIVTATIFFSIISLITWLHLK